MLVINLMGRVFMPMQLDCPFRRADEILEEFKNDDDLSAIFVDFHAETTSEKMALAVLKRGLASMHIDEEQVYHKTKLLLKI